MPNNSAARREKGKKKRREETSPSPPQQVTEESVESFLSRSTTDPGFQEDDEDVTWESELDRRQWTILSPLFLGRLHLWNLSRQERKKEKG